ncbi:hypothetical protein Cgig2_010472 [Carnegiea gigantea]|uniref:Uncharacterized protein n=1 Tax=Carnegiea gigantea TaxID=171969 RepID=A0A9Q1Q9T8_9CARY|nr:hypothetical protein Cgig2_010472 [Carnegiea gigantea]
MSVCGVTSSKQSETHFSFPVKGCSVKSSKKSGRLHRKPSTKDHLRGLFKMVTFMDKTTSGRRYLHIQPSENDVVGEETKLSICNPIMSLCKSDCELTSKFPLSCTYLFVAYHKLMQGRKGKPTIEQRNKYHVSKKPDQENRIPHPGILSSLTDAGARGWSDCQTIFYELRVAIGQRTETFLAAFLSCWLCMVILPVRDAGCIHPGTFSIASLMASGIA